MPRLASIASAPPETVVTQSVAAAYARETFGPAISNIGRLMPVFENTGIETRRVYKNLDWYRHDHTLADTSAAYIEAAPRRCVNKQHRSDCIVCGWSGRGSPVRR